MQIRLFLLSVLITIAGSQGPKTCFRLYAVRIKAAITSDKAKPKLDLLSHSKIYTPCKCVNPMMSCLPPLVGIAMVPTACTIHCGNQIIGSCQLTLTPILAASTSTLTKGSGEKLNILIKCDAASPIQEGLALKRSQAGKDINLILQDLEDSTQKYEVACKEKLWGMMCLPVSTRFNNVSTSYRHEAPRLFGGLECEFGCVKPNPPKVELAGQISLSVEEAEDGNCQGPSTTRNFWSASHY